MALPLVALHESVSESEPYYELSLDSYARYILQQNFTEAFTPVLLIGEIDTGLEDSLPAEFVNASEGDCLLVWPHPVVVQGRNLLLMKMWDFDILEDEEGLVEAVQRSICVFLSIAEHCIVSFDRSLVFRGLRFMQSLYGELQERGLHRVHFVVLDKGRAMNRSYTNQEAEFKSTAEAQFTEFVPSGEWRDTDRLFQRVLNGNSAPLFNNFQSWADFLRLVIRFANIDSDRSCFVQYFPRFDGPQFPQFEETLEKFEQKQNILRKASVRKFLVRGKGPSCTLDDTLLSTLRSNFDQRKPTVVLTVMGEPGIGKSTFLNHLIQRALQRRSPYPFFSIGNTQTHTTRESFILSCPLPLPNSENQMLLIDLEGLGGMETLSDKEAVMQHNLVSGVLAVSSVPCIFVKNVAAHQQTVEGYIDRLVYLSKSFGFQCDRIHFLFHDKDFRPGEESDNVHMLEWISNLNRHYFGGRPVIRLTNKPLFADSSKAEMCRNFLNTLLADCDYPKLNSSGSFLTVAEMLVQIQYITQHSSTDVGEITADLTSIDVLKSAKFQELEELSYSITSDGTLSLVNQFNERCRMFICSMREAQHIGNQQRYLQLAVEAKAQEIRQVLQWTESNFTIFSKWDEEQIKAQIYGRLNDYYDDSIWIGTFLNKCSALERRLRDIFTHYPAQEARVLIAVAYLNETREYLRNWYIGHYAVQAVVTVGTAGLGMAATGARAAVMAARLGWGAVATGTAAVGKLASFISSKRLVSPKAHALFVMRDNAIVWVEESLRLFKRDSKKCVILVISRQSFPITEVLNSLVSETVELGSCEVEKFRSGESAQVVSFQYPSRQAEGIVLLFTLNRTLADNVIELVAAALFGRISVCCLCENEESDFSLNLLAAAGGEARSMRAKVCLTLKRSLPESFRDRIKAAVLNTHLAPVTFEVSDLNSDEQSNFKLLLSECMKESRLLDKDEAANLIQKAREAVQGFGLQ